LFTKYEHPSIELAISGKHGVENWVDHLLDELNSPELVSAIIRAREADRPVGAVLLEFATEGSGASKAGAHKILNELGSLAGNILADFALTYKATGGVYLTGSMSLALSDYLVQNTGFINSFLRRGSKDHASWLEDMLKSTPIYLITDPDVAAVGALELACQL
jgi:glucokinase